MASWTKVASAVSTEHFSGSAIEKCTRRGGGRWQAGVFFGPGMADSWGLDRKIWLENTRTNHGGLVRWENHRHLRWIYPLKMVIFHSYVGLPEGSSEVYQLATSEDWRVSENAWLRPLATKQAGGDKTVNKQEGMCLTVASTQATEELVVQHNGFNWFNHEMWLYNGHIVGIEWIMIWTT